MPKQSFDLNLSISFDEDVAMDRNKLCSLIQDMIMENLPNGDATRELDVSVTSSTPPKLLVVVSNGMAEVRAGIGAVDVALVDLDREGQDLTADDVDSALSFERHGGDDQAKMDAELADARKGLEDYLQHAPTP